MNLVLGVSFELACHFFLVKLLELNLLNLSYIQVLYKNPRVLSTFPLYTVHNHTLGYSSPHMQLSDYSLVQFLPLNISDEDSIGSIILYIDSAIQYGEDLEVHVPKVSFGDNVIYCACTLFLTAGSG